MRQILLAMCLGRLAGPRSVGGKFTLQRRASTSSSLNVSFGPGIRHVSRLKWINSLSNMDASSWRGQLESDFFSDLWGLDLLFLREWAQGLQTLHSLKNSIGDEYGPILVSQVAGKLEMEAVQLAMQEGLCAGHRATQMVGARLETIDGVPKFCTEAITWISRMLDSVDDFLKEAIVLTGERVATPPQENVPQPFEDAVAKLIHAICDLEFIRGVILARMVDSADPFRSVKPGSRAIFAKHHKDLARLVNRHAGQDICGQATLEWLRMLKGTQPAHAHLAEIARANAERGAEVGDQLPTPTETVVGEQPPQRTV